MLTPGERVWLSIAIIVIAIVCWAAYGLVLLLS